MFIQLTEVFTSEGKQMNAEAELEMTSFDNGTERFAITEKSPVSFTFTNLEKGKILVEGEMKLTLQAACDRCLTEVPVVFLTGTTEKEVLLECAAMQPRAVVLKSTGKEGLLEKVRDIFEA